MLERFYQIDTAVGIAIHTHPDGSFIVNGCSICVKGTQLDIEKKIIGKESLKDLVKELSANSIISLNLAGKGVLTKSFELESESGSLEFATLLPGADQDEYYRQDFKSGNRLFISLIRKSEADRWITQLRTMGFNVFMLSLGPFVVDQILTQLNNYGDALIFDGYEVVLNDKKNWIKYALSQDNKAEFPFKIESERMDERLLLPYSAAFQLALHDRLTVINANANEITDVRDGWIQKRKLKAQGSGLLMVFFTLLLINFIVFNHFYKENIELQSRTSLMEKSLGDVQQQERDIKEQEAILQKLGYTGGKPKSVMIDQLCALIPNGVTLTSIEVNPVDQKKSRELRITYFTDHQIKITGSAERILNVNEWLALMGTCKWLKSTGLESYRVDPETGIGHFVIKVAY